VTETKRETDKGDGVGDKEENGHRDVGKEGCLHHTIATASRITVIPNR